MDIVQWQDEIDIENIIPAIVLGAMQSAKAERTPSKYRIVRLGRRI
jgi:hypothetical protein